MTTVTANILVEGQYGEGEALVLSAPISFWGGVDPKSGIIINVRHPQHRASVASKILFIPATIGSSSASTILLELIHCGKAPAAIVLHEPDAILLLGLVAAREMDLNVPPALLLPREAHPQFDGMQVTISPDGTLVGIRPST